ncbi:MAG: cell division protein SepF [Rubrobacter sp.]|jgi:cell division inhibitor SepF|nr:cell division protein SepF [Rubrobacter sp.]MDQ3924467.1 cell division protein SepF [Actinomycetota bacterium]
MGVRDRLERMAAWFGFGVEEDEYYEEEDERRPYAKDRYAGEDAEPGPTVRRLNRSERSSAFGTSLGDLFGSEDASGRDRSYGAQEGSARLRAVPDQQVPPARVSVINPASFNDAQALADRFKRQQPVILNLQQADAELSRRMVDFCSGLTYALDGNIQTVANRVFLLTPRNVEVSAEERKRLAERAFFNQL